MKKTILIIVGFIIVILGISLLSNKNNNSIKDDKIKTSEGYVALTSQELSNMLLEKDFTLVDVHTPEQVHISGTDYFIPYDDIGALTAVLPDKEAKIVLYCRSGNMSKASAKALVDLGYTNIFDLTNGMNEWKAENRETIPKGSVPTGIISENLAYVAFGPANSVGILDIDSEEIIGTLPAGNNPHGIALAGNYLFTSSTKMGPNEMMMEPDHDDGEEIDMKKMMMLGSDVLSVTDISKKELIKEIEIGGGTHHMASSFDDSFILVTVPSQSGVAIIDTETLEKVAFVETGKISNYVAVSPDSKTAFVSNKGDNTISIVDLVEKKLLINIIVGTRPDHIAVSSNGEFVYVTNSGSDDISVIDVNKQKVIVTIDVEESPHGIAILPDNNKIYVSNTESKTVSVINTKTNKVFKNIIMENEVEHVEINPEGTKVLVNSESGKNIAIINTETDTLETIINIGKQPHQVVFR